MKIKRKKGFFSISAVAKMFSVHQQTIRLYEKQGLIEPTRSSGNTRLFSEEDIDRLEEIIHMTHEMGINLAGVEMVLKLKKQILKLQKEINRAFNETSRSLDEQVEESKNLIQENNERLLTLKQERKGPKPKELKHAHEEKNNDLDSWEIDYEE